MVPHFPPTASRYSLRHRARIAQDFRRMQRGDLSVAHQHPSRHDGVAHVVAAADVDEMRHRVEHRRLAGAVHRDRDDIRLLTGFEAADAIAQAERLGAAACREFEGLARRERLRVERGHLLQQRRHAHRLEHVEIVVARRAVRAEARVHAVRDPFRSRPRCRSRVSCCCSGLCDTPTPRFARMSMSASSSHTPWAASERPLHTPSESR